MIPIIFSIFGYFFIIKICTKGIKIRLVPVMNAEFDADVCFNPIVCVMNPIKRKIPNIYPYINFLNLNCLTLLKKKIKKRANVIRNLKKIKALGDTYSRDIFTEGKLNPHVKAVNSKIASALYCFMLDKFLMLLFKTQKIRIF